MELGPATRQLAEMLHRYREGAAEQRGAEVRTIEQRFAGEQTILIGDMPSFTRRTEEEGIVHYLSLIFAMREVCRRVIAEGNGYLYKIDADNVFVSFTSPEEGVQTALRIQEALHERNTALPEHDRVELGIGLAHGRVLAIDREDVWGQPVNLAAKLGEDISRGGEILAHESMLPWIQPLGLDLEARELKLSGVTLRYFLVRWS
jgi:class 3 adenylate cyclase